MRQTFKGWLGKVWEWIKRSCGNSKTIAVAYAAQLLALLDELKLLDWSSLLGAERAGRVLAIAGAVMFLLRVISTGAVSFKER